MDVMKPEYSFSTYQGRQLKVLESIDQSLSKNLTISTRLVNNMSKIEGALSDIAHASENMAENVYRLTKDITGTAKEFSSEMQRAKVKTEKFTEELDKSSRNINKLDREFQGAFENLLDHAKGAIQETWRFFGGTSGIGREIDRLSEASNYMIRLSGMNGEFVREFRSDIMSVIGDLNRDTGMYYSPTASYEQLIRYAQGVTSNLDAIQEMARPLLLAQESMHINVNDVTTLFNKFYTRYSFSSTNMEDTLNEIRGNTAGNSANAEATLQNLKSLESWISSTAGNDNALRESLMESISHYTSWLESMNVDSGQFTEYLKAIAYGDYSKHPELINILTLGGMSSGLQATDIARSGGYEEITIALLKGINEIYNRVEGSAAVGPALDNYNLSRELAMDVHNLMNSPSFIGLEEFIKKSSPTESLENIVEDKYVSATNKTHHFLEQIYAKVAGIQERLGVGVSDIALIVLALKSLGGARLIGSAGGAGSILGRAGSALGGLGSTIGRAGGALAGRAATAIGLGLSNPIGWALLAIGGVALLGTSIHKAANTIGETSAIEEAYEEASKTIIEHTKDNKDFLLDIQSTLKDSEDIEKERNRLINSGILSENDIENARNANKKGLEALTKAYIEASEEFSEDYESAMDKYERMDISYAKELKKNLNEVLQDWNDSGKLKNGSKELETVDNLFYSLYKDLQSQQASGVEFDKTTQKMFDRLNEAYEDGKLSKREANRLIDLGIFNSGFVNSNFGVDAVVSSVNKAFSGNEKVLEEILPESRYRGSKETSHVLELATKALNATNAASAIEYLDQLKEEGYTSKEYSEIADAAKKWGVKGYATGTNYIPNDQLAVVHEGEAIVPKKYNPAVNSAEFRELAYHMQRNQEDSARESQEAKAYLIDFVKELKEIKEFLEEWKSDSIKRSTISDINNRHQASRSLIQQYLPSI